MATARTVPVNKGSLPGPVGPPGVGVTDWISLSDTDPSSFAGQAGKPVLVNSAEDGLEFGAALIANGITCPLHVTVNNQVGGVMTGQVVYGTLPASSVELAQADALATARALGFVVFSAANGASTTVTAGGFIIRADWTPVSGASGLVPGDRYFLSDTTAGNITNVAPTADGSLVVQVGIAADATTMSILIEAPILL